VHFKKAKIWSAAQMRLPNLKERDLDEGHDEKKD